MEKQTQNYKEGSRILKMAQAGFQHGPSQEFVFPLLLPLQVVPAPGGQCSSKSALKPKDRQSLLLPQRCAHLKMRVWRIRKPEAWAVRYAEWWGGGWYSGRIKSKLLLRLVKGSSLLQNGEVVIIVGSEHYRPFGILSYFPISLALRILVHIAS